MPYTIWSRGELLGGSELDYSRVVARQRSGDFLPTAFGETLIPASSSPPNAASNESALELRGPDGAVIPTEWIEIRDTAYTGALVPTEPLAAEEAEGCDAELLEDDLDATWEGDFPRFEIDVKLVDDSTIP